MCSTPARTASASAAVPGTAAACGANTLAPFSAVRSAISRKEMAPKISRMTHMNEVGPSTLTEPSAATVGGWTRQFRRVMNSAAAMAA